MPLIQIDLDREVFDSLGERLSSAVHQAQLDALEIPADDLFQVFTPHGPGELRFDPGYNGVDRRQRPVVDVAGDDHQVDLLGLHDLQHVVDVGSLGAEHPDTVERPSQVPVGGVQDAHATTLVGHADRTVRHTPSRSAAE